MSYNANVFRVLIASPGDVSIERNITREVIYEWDAINSLLRKIVLLPVAWETHSTPEMGDRAQSILNKQLKGCDLLIGVFWTRIGTATGEYPSGTVEEIEEHIRAEKPVMLYFSSAPVVPESIDHDQYSELTRFRESCKSRGLFETYSDYNDFRTKLYRQLQLKINSDSSFAKVYTPLSGNEAPVESDIPNIPKLSREAQVLLKEASQAGDGDIFQLHMMGGFLVQSNSKTFGDRSSPRDQAIWEGAIDELEKLGLVKDRGHKRELFGITRDGYRIAEMITL
jgi:hypothetical protein